VKSILKYAAQSFCRLCERKNSLSTAKIRRVKRTLKGSLTLEAAIALPIFIVVILGVSFFIRVVAIQETVHYALSEAGAILSDSSYLVSKTGMIDIQHTAYETALIREANYQFNETNLANQINTLIAEPAIDLPAFPEVSVDVTGANIIEFTDNWLNSIVQVRNQFSDFLSSIMTLSETVYQSIGYVYEDSSLLISNQNQSDYISAVNGFLVGKMAKLIMKSYISDTELRALGVEGGYAGMDFSKSSYMLSGNDIILSVQYQVRVPFFSDIIPEFFMTDTIRIRAFIGNQNYLTSYMTKQGAEDDTDKQTVYVTRDGARYHIDADCFHIHIEAKPIAYGGIYEPIDFCETCSGAAGEMSQYDMLYKTDSDSKYHIDSNCCRIVRNPVAISVDEATIEGYTPCIDCSRGE
jgi:hypothetical protein